VIKLFIWDLDNTIIASSELLWGAFSRVAYKYLGKKLSPQEIVAMYGPPESDIIEKMVGRELKTQALKDFYDFYLTYHDSKVKVFEPVVEVIRYLRKKHTLQALFTSKGKRVPRLPLKEQACLPFFTLLFVVMKYLVPNPILTGWTKY